MAKWQFSSNNHIYGMSDCLYYGTIPKTLSFYSIVNFQTTSNADGNTYYHMGHKSLLNIGMQIWK